MGESQHAAGAVSDDAFDTAINAAYALLAPHANSFSTTHLSGDRFIRRLTNNERLGRLVDFFRVVMAGDADSRSGDAVDTFTALGYRSVPDAVAALTGISKVAAKQRIRTGKGITPRISLTGAPVAPKHPTIAKAVSAGTLGVEAAGLLVRELDDVAPRVEPAVLHEAEAGLVELAAGTTDRPPVTVDLVRQQAKLFVAYIDPDGARPKEERARRLRSFRIGKEDADGLIPVHGRLTPEVGLTLRHLTDAHMRTVTFEEESVAAAAAGDTRTRDQKRHDTLADILSAASRVADAPELAGTAPAVTVTVTQTTLETGHGVGVIDGTDIPISLDSVERFIDSRGLQTVTMTPTGKILSLGSVQRCFTGSQRRAITARDGGCIIPGCSIPAGWCEIHHVVPWRNGGKTHTDNGVLLCWGHHQNIDTGPWRINMPGGVPHVRGPGHHEWTPTTKARTRPSFDLDTG